MQSTWYRKNHIRNQRCVYERLLGVFPAIIGNRIIIGKHQLTSLKEGIELIFTQQFCSLAKAQASLQLT